jgi:predicted secreted protein
LTESRREANALSAAAKREAEKTISEATVAVGEFRSWLTSAISESERLYRIQTQSLNAAEQAIGETRSRLKQAFERLAALQGDIDANIDADNRPVEKSFVRNGGRTAAAPTSSSESDVKKSSTAPAKKVVKKSATKKRK